MPNRTVRASATALPDFANLARGFIAACRARGHRPYVSQSGRFGISLSVGGSTAPAAQHHLGAGYAYPLGFDTAPFDQLRVDPDYIAKLIAATLEAVR